MSQLQFVMELLVVELTVVVVVPVAAAWETDSGSRDVGVAFDTDGTDSGLVNHNGLVRRTVGHGIVDHGTDHGIVGVRSVVYVFCVVFRPLCCMGWMQMLIVYFISGCQ